MLFRSQAVLVPLFWHLILLRRQRTQAMLERIFGRGFFSSGSSCMSTWRGASCRAPPAGSGWCAWVAAGVLLALVSLVVSLRRRREGEAAGR